MVTISAEIRYVLSSIYLHEISEGKIDTPTYNKIVGVLFKLDKPLCGYLRKPPKYLSWARDGMFMTSVCGYDFGLYWNEEEGFADVVEVFHIMNESVTRIVPLKESELWSIIKECVERVFSEQKRQMLGDYEIMDGDGLEHEADSIIQFGHFNDIRMYFSEEDTYCLMRRCDNGSYFFTQIVDAPELGEKKTKYKPVKPKDVPPIILRDAKSLIHSSATLRSLLV